MEQEEKRHLVSFSEAEIDALIVTISQVRVIDIHLCRCKAVHTGLGELKAKQDGIRAIRRNND